jgi:hypothetical protein
VRREVRWRWRGQPIIGPNRTSAHGGASKRLIEKKPFKLVAVALANRWRASRLRSCAARRFIGKFRRKERR